MLASRRGAGDGFRLPKHSRPRASIPRQPEMKLDAAKIQMATAK
nr:hypothetical protein [uncultured Kingella sp.]